MRRTKIVATLGPKSSTPEVFHQLVQAGVDVARINLSHGSTDQHREVIRMVRTVEREAGHPIGIMLDTAGPEVRLAIRSGESLDLKKDDFLVIGTGDDCDLSPSLPKVLEFLEEGDELLVGDGNIVFRVVSSGSRAKVQVREGGRLTQNKKITCTKKAWPLPVLTDADHESLLMGAREQIDWIAASFIHTPDDVVEVRRAVEEMGYRIPIMSKIETRLGMENLDAIIRMSDGVMVARGDLGVEYPPEDVPWLQKMIIDAANRAGKTVVTATQMLESMVHETRPTRAEITDIAHAVLEGTDAVMLSEETAAGGHPVEAVKVMARAAEVSEAHPGDSRAREYVHGTITDAVCHAALTAAEDLEARLIITATESGHTAESMAAHRPHVPILALTPHESVARRLTMVWGLNTHLMRAHGSLEGMVNEAISVAIHTEWASPGDRVVITAGASVGEAGTTNVLRVVTIGTVLIRGQGLGTAGEVKAPVIVLSRDKVAALSPDDIEGKVLVAASTDADWTPFMERAQAIVVEQGGLTSHAAVVGVSLGVPTVVGATGAVSTLKTGQMVTVDSGRGIVLDSDH